MDLKLQAATGKDGEDGGSQVARETELGERKTDTPVKADAEVDTLAERLDIATAGGCGGVEALKEVNVKLGNQQLMEENKILRSQTRSTGVCEEDFNGDNSIILFYTLLSVFSWLSLH